MKAIGVQDVWSPALLERMAPNPAKGGQQSSSQQQQQQPNTVQQNKARVELIIMHLTQLRFYNVPKPNVLQTMTTPKNWTHMLQILYFLANNCLVCGAFRLAPCQHNQQQPHLTHIFVVVLVQSNRIDSSCRSTTPTRSYTRLTRTER